MGLLRRLSLLCLTASACAPYGFTATTQNAGTAKPAGCAFDILTTRPDQPFVEVGIFDVSSRLFSLPSDAGTFKKAVSDDVCRVGGDAVLAEINGYGAYVRGTVLRYKKAPVA